MTRRAPRIAIAAGVTLIVVLVLTLVIALASADRRSDDARGRLADAAEQLQSCRADRGTYDGCQTGEELVSERVAWDGTDGYELHVDVFAVGTFRIIGRGASKRRFTCEARGSRCDDGRWAPPSD